MHILKLVHKPTQVHITRLARENCRREYGDDFACLMLESVKNLEEQSQKKPIKGLLNKFINKICPKKELTINISSDSNRDFFVNTHLKIGSYNFVSKRKPFSITETLSSLKNLKKIVEQTKDDVLKQLGDFNKMRRGFDRKLFRD